MEPLWRVTRIPFQPRHMRDKCARAPERFVERGCFPKNLGKRESLLRCGEVLLYAGGVQSPLAYARGSHAQWGRRLRFVPKFTTNLHPDVEISPLGGRVAFLVMIGKQP